MNKSTLEEESVCIQDEYRVNKYIKTFNFSTSQPIYFYQWVLFFIYMLSNTKRKKRKLTASVNGLK